MDNSQNNVNPPNTPVDVALAYIEAVYDPEFTTMKDLSTIERTTLETCMKRVAEFVKTGLKDEMVETTKPVTATQESPSAAI